MDLLQRSVSITAKCYRVSLAVGNTIFKKAMGFFSWRFPKESVLHYETHSVEVKKKKKICRNAFQQLTSDKHGSAAGCFPCTVFYETGVGPSILWQWLLHYIAHLSAVKGGYPKESHFTCQWYNHRNLKPAEQMQRVGTIMRKDNRSITGKMSLLWSECNFVPANIVQTTPDIVPKYNRILSIFVRVTIIIHICNSISYFCGHWKWKKGHGAPCLF